MGVEVRPAGPADREAWLRLREALWPAAEGEHAAEVELLLERGADGRWPQAALLAELDGRAVGLAEVSVRPVAEGCATQGVGYLEGWYVEPDCRRRGVGRALVAACADWARAQGCSELASDTEHDNEVSRRAHLALGFEDAGLVRCFRRTLEAPADTAPVGGPRGDAPESAAGGRGAAVSEAGSGAVPVRGWRRVGPAALVFVAACAVHLAIVFGLQWLVPYALGTESYALLWPGILGMFAFHPISSVLGPRFGLGWILADVVLWGALATWAVLRLRDVRARRPAGPARTHRTGADPLTGRR